MTKKKKLHFGWLIFITVSMYLFCLYDVTYNSLFVLPLASALGVTRGTILVFTTFYSFSGIASSMVYGALLANRRIPLRLLLIGGCVIMEVSYLLFAFGNELWMIYLAGILMGVPVQGCTVVMPTVFASNWYATRIRGKLLSVQNCLRGAGGILWPILVQLAINAAGYRAGYMVLMAAALIPFVLGFFMKYRTPDEKGLLPLGLTPESEGSVGIAKQDNMNIGWNLRHAMRTAGFWLMVIGVAVFGLENGFASNFSGIAEEFLAGQDGVDPAMVAAVMLSWRSAGNMVGNFSVGFVVDWLGSRKATVMWLLLFALFFPVTLFFGHHVMGLYIAGFLFGLNSSILRNPFPLTVRELFGAKHFSPIWGVVNAVKPMMSGLAATCIAVSYDLVGSYVGSLIFGLCAALLTLVFFFAGSSFVGKYDYEQYPDLDSKKAA